MAACNSGDAALMIEQKAIPELAVLLDDERFRNFVSSRRIGFAPAGLRSVAITLHGSRLGDAQEILCYDSGLAFTDLKAVSDGAVNATLKIAPDAPLGEKRLRLRCTGGWSLSRRADLGWFDEERVDALVRDAVARTVITLTVSAERTVANALPA